MSNVLQEYLVKLNIQNDEPGFRRMESLIATASASITTHTSGMARQILEAQGAMVGAFIAVSGAIIGVADRAANADMEFRKLGLRMMMSTESARKYSIITKALGADLNEIMRIPELRERWNVMSADADQFTRNMIKLGGEDALKGVRGISFEFTRMKTGLQYLEQYFAVSLFEKLFPKGAGETFTKWMDRLYVSLPGIADKLSTYAIPVLKDTWSIMKALGGMIKEAATAFTNLIGIFSSDQSIVGAKFSFDNLATAIGKVTAFLKAMILAFTDVEATIAHMSSAMALALRGRFGDAVDEVRKGLSGETDPNTGERKPGSGGGGVGIVGTLVAGGLGARVAYGAGAGLLGWLGVGGGAAAGAGTAGAAGAAAAALPITLSLAALAAAGYGAVRSTQSWNTLKSDDPNASWLSRVGRMFTTKDDEFEAMQRGQLSKTPKTSSIDTGLQKFITSYESGGNPNALSFRNNNPGNLMKNGEFQKFTTLAEGEQAQLDQINRNIARGLTLNEFFGGKKGVYPGWAPGSDPRNHPDAYSAAGAKQLGIDPNVPLNRYLKSTAMPAPVGGSASVKQNVTVSLGGIYITQPNATAEHIQHAVAEGIREGLADQIRGDLAQLQPAWG